MPKGRDKPTRPIVRLSGGRLSPASQYDAAELDAYAQETEFDLVPRTKRSDPQHGTYWRMLTHAVESTGRWKSREALHTALKVQLGYVEPIFNMKGTVIGMKPDSTAFDAMSHKEFGEYMQKAVQALAEALGYDPLRWMDD